MEINKDLIAASSTPIVLAILAEEDSYGYAILKRVRELSGGRMEWTDGMLYPVLHRLERLGHVEARWEVAESGRRRKYYRITSRGPGSARRGTQAVASGGRYATGHLAGALPSRPGQPPGVSRATATGSLSDAGSRSRGIARGADRPMAELPPPPAGDPLRRCSGAGRPSARAGSGPGRRGARHR